VRAPKLVFDRTENVSSTAGPARAAPAVFIDTGRSNDTPVFAWFRVPTRFDYFSIAFLHRARRELRRFPYFYLHDIPLHRCVGLFRYTRAICSSLLPLILISPRLFDKYAHFTYIYIYINRSTTRYLSAFGIIVLNVVSYCVTIV